MATDRKPPTASYPSRQWSLSRGTQHKLQEAETALFTYAHRPQASDCILSLSAMVTVSRHPAQTARSGNCSLYLCPPTASLRLPPIPVGNGHAPSTFCKKQKLLSLNIPMPTDSEPPTASYPSLQCSLVLRHPAAVEEASPERCKTWHCPASLHTLPG